METKIELENIEPFCETWFKNCFFNLLFVILKHFNKDIRELLVNDVFLYKYNKNSLCLIEKSMKPIEEVLNDNGIGLQRIILGKNGIMDFIDSLSNGRLVIVWQDLYFASYRDDFYRRKHWKHAILLFGFDKSEKRFNIIEQSFKDSYFYEKKYASFSDILKASVGLFKYFPNEISDNVVFYLKEESTQIDCLSDSNAFQLKYIENFIKHKTEIEESIIQIESFYNDFKDIISDETLLRNNVDSIIENLNRIISYKKADLYRYIKLFGLQTELKLLLLESIISEWEVVRGVLVKFKLTTMYKTQLLNSALNKVNNIIQLEHEFYDEFNKLAMFLKPVQ
jgi:hypothetical protein